MQTVQQRGWMLAEDERARRLMRETLGELSKRHAPPLLPRDVVGLTLARLLVEFGRNLQPGDVQLDELESHYFGAACLMVSFAPRISVQASFMDDGAPPEEAMGTFRSAWSKWEDEGWDIVRGCGWDPKAVDEHTREGRLAAIWMRTWARTSVGRETLLKSLKSAVKARGGRVTCDEDRSREALRSDIVLLMYLHEGKGTLERLLRVCDDGKSTIEWDRIRALGRARELDRRSVALDAEAHDGNSELLRTAVEAAETTERLIECHDLADRIRVAVATRLADARPKSAAWHYLSNFEAIAMGERSISDVARDAGLALSALTKARDLERGSLARAVGARM